VKPLRCPPAEVRRLWEEPTEASAKTAEAVGILAACGGEDVKRATNGIATAAGVPAERAPIIEVSKDSVPATVNDPVLTRRVAVAMEKALGEENVVPTKPVMASEDFSLFALSDPNPPISMFRLGAVDPAKWKEAHERGTRLPSLHSSEFAPVPEPAIRAGVEAMTVAVMDLLKKQ
jgi:metal-dependent amidase/aminoacylase/carboxypeptidase family protein